MHPVRTWLAPLRKKVGTGSIEAITYPVYIDLRIRATVSIRATFGGSQSWPKSRLFCRCCPLCLCTISRFSLVLFPHVCQSTIWKKSLQCAWGDQCDLARVAYRDEYVIYQCTEYL